MRKITVYFKSRSSKSVYKLVRTKDGTIRCQCPGATYHGHCWHQDQAVKYQTV